MTAARLAEAASQFAEGARAENTRRAYAADWADFSAWCQDAGGVDALPAEPATVANYLTAKAGELRVSTLARRLAAIRDKHLEADLQVPESAELRRVWSGIRKTCGRPPTKKKALVREDLARVVAALPGSLTGIRDRAILLIGFAGALRRSELAAIELDGPQAGTVRLVFVAEGVEVQLQRSKGDQEGKGQAVGVPYTGTALCPVQALEAWLKASRIGSGPVFRRIDRWGRLGSSAISPATAAAVVKRSCSAVGLNPRVFAGHSLRRGFITTASRAGADPDRLRRHARHARIDTTLGYIEEAGRFEESLAGKVGL